MTNAMKYFQFLIFISSSVFTSSQNNFFVRYGWKNGIEAFEINTVLPFSLQFPAIQEFDISQFALNEEFSYILLLTEYVELESTDKVSNEEQEVYYSYTLLYIITTTNYEEGLGVTVDYLTRFYEYFKGRGNLPVTITRDTHGIQSYELRLLLSFDDIRRSEYISHMWKSGQQIEFNDNLLFRLYKLTSSPNIMEPSLMSPYMNVSDAFVGHYDTKLIAFTTENWRLREYTYDFVSFIQRCSREKLEVYQVGNHYALFEEIPHWITGQENEEESYKLHEYNDKCEKLQTISAIKGSGYHLTSELIQTNKYYILENDLLHELHVFIGPSTNIETLNCLLKQEQSWGLGTENYEIIVFQTHQLNTSFLIAFKDLVVDILNNNVTDNVRKFITVCKNANTKFPGSSSSVPN